jgi:6-phosphogluconolactonase (cycloisomerase 2 family)
MFWAVLLLAACGGNTFSVGGTVTGLAGTVVLQNNGSGNLSVSASGAFTFASQYTAGSAYKVTVLTQPIGQVCTVSAGSGKVTSDISSVIVSCANTTLPRYAYVVNSGSDTISQYTVGTGGTLTPMTTATVATGTTPYAIAMTASNAYVANSVSGDVSQYTITDGVLTAMSTPTVPAGTRPYAVSVHPDGGFLYVVNKDSSNISQYTIEAGGALKPMTQEKVAAGTNPFSIAIFYDPSSAKYYAYVANAGSSDISQFNIETDGRLTPMSQATVPAGANANPYSITVKSSGAGKYVYVANSGSDRISQYAIGTDGSLTALVPATAAVSTGTTPYAVTVDPSGQFVYVANEGSRDISQYKIEPDGQLTAMSPARVSAGANPRAVTVDQSGQFVYVADYGGDTISQYSIVSGGALKANTTASTVATGTKPVFVITAQ